MSGWVAAAFSPSTSLCTGTVRQPIRRRPWRSTTRSMMLRQRAVTSAPSCGKKTIATPMSSGGTSPCPSRAASRAKSRRGTCVSTPAPSPVLASASTAPRCVRLITLSRARPSTRCDGRPLRSAMKPTPHESCSDCGSYSPRRGGNPASSTGCRRDSTPAVRCFSCESIRVFSTPSQAHYLGARGRKSGPTPPLTPSRSSECVDRVVSRYERRTTVGRLRG